MLTLTVLVGSFSKIKQKIWTTYTQEKTPILPCYTLPKLILLYSGHYATMQCIGNLWSVSVTQLFS